MLNKENGVIWYKHNVSLGLEDKIQASKKYIKNFCKDYDREIYVSFSGGLDSTVLLNIVRDVYPDCVGVFSDTGLEYPEIREFVKRFDNIIWVKPKKSFKWVIDNYGYPVISKSVSRFLWDVQNPTKRNENTRNLRLTGMSSVTKPGKKMPTMKIPNKWMFMIDAPFKISDRCCDYLKKQPLNDFSKESGLHSILGLMGEESNTRLQMAYKYGTVVPKKPESSYCQPIIFWEREDILKYIKSRNLDYCKVYGNIENINGKLHTSLESRTGCMFCMFGVDREPHPNRFERMKRSHPNQWNYCINKLGCGKVMDFMNIDYGKEID